MAEEHCIHNSVHVSCLSDSLTQMRGVPRASPACPYRVYFKRHRWQYRYQLEFKNLCPHLQALLIVHEDQDPLRAERVDAAAQRVHAVTRVRDHVRVVQLRRQADCRARLAGPGVRVLAGPC